MNTNNTSWGFWGTMENSDKDAKTEWSKAFDFIKSLCSNVDGKLVTDHEIRGFMDSKAGRHLADGVVDMGTIQAVHAKWPVNGKGLWFVDTVRAFRQEAW